MHGLHGTMHYCIEAWLMAVGMYWCMDCLDSSSILWNNTVLCRSMADGCGHVLMHGLPVLIQYFMEAPQMTVTVDRCMGCMEQCSIVWTDAWTAWTDLVLYGSTTDGCRYEQIHGLHRQIQSCTETWLMAAGMDRCMGRTEWLIWNVFLWNICLVWDFQDQSTQWGHVESSQFT